MCLDPSSYLAVREYTEDALEEAAVQNNRKWILLVKTGVRY